MTVHINRGGEPWEPKYLLAINGEDCIGCGRCYKVCGWGVLTLMGVNEDDELVALNGDDDDDDDEIERKIMTIANAGNCIGCGSCGRVCGKSCQTHGAAA